MDFKESRYKMESEYFSPFATLSKNTLGREIPEEDDSFRTPFQRDRDRIIHCKSFRRLIHKTQVFLLAEGDHYRTRLTHTLEVSQVARSIARALNMNEDLTEAISLGHDLGHSAFGHSGERTLAKLSDGYFEHNKQSRRVVELVENEGKGLNLTLEVRDGIENHRLSLTPMTLEGRIVAYSDRIAYINHDIDDAIRAGVIKNESLPQQALSLGITGRERLGAFIEDIVYSSLNKPIVVMSKPTAEIMQVLYEFMFEKVYTHKSAKRHEAKAEEILTFFFELYTKQPELMGDTFQTLLERGEPLQSVVCDCIACMTDGYALKMYNKMKKNR